VEQLVLAKLEELAVSGFTSTAIEAAINTIEFSLRENNTGSFPRGLSLMLRAVGAWIYDQDPFQPLQWEVGAPPLLPLPLRTRADDDDDAPASAPAAPASPASAGGALWSATS
jgi:hypothetical protein